MLILYVPVVICLLIITHHPHGPILDKLNLFVMASSWSLSTLMLLASIYSLGLFIISLGDRNPQIQFAIELIVSMGLLLLIPIT